MPSTSSVLLVVGTRPEAVKLAPVVLALRATTDLQPITVVTGQHPELADEALAAFDLTADRRLDPPGLRPRSQGALLAHLLPGLEAQLDEVAPSAVIVQGDTASALAGAMAAHWRRTPLLHLEAGLRTPSIDEPFPEEAYRRMITRLATVHLAPTPRAAAHLRAEGVEPTTITCTGNTVVDATRIGTSPRSRLGASSRPAGGEQPTRIGRIALLTVHRRESWGEPLHRIMAGMHQLLAADPLLQVIVPLHPNPAVRDVVIGSLGRHDRVTLTDPLPHPDLIRLLRRADVVLTDSGGIQEEAPSFGTPVVVLRDTTERPEAVEAGLAWLVGTDPAAIRHRTLAVLEQRRGDRRTANPFGDGHAAGRVVEAVRAVLAGGPLPRDWVPETGDGSATPAPPGDRARSSPAVSAAGSPAADPAAERAHVAHWTERLANPGASPGAEGVRAVRSVLSPPEPVRTAHADDQLGEVTEIRRGGQRLRHLPGLPVELVEPGDAGDPWRWGARLRDGPTWIESAAAPIRLEVPGAQVLVREGAAAVRWDPGSRTSTVTVISGRAEVRADRGDVLDLGPRQCTTVHAVGTLGGLGHVPPEELRQDPWITANRRLSHASPIAGRLGHDPLLLLPCT